MSELGVAFTPDGLNEAELRGRRVLVVDVLRATTTAVQALAAGARRIVPAATVSEAAELAAGLGRENTLLCGEREGKKISGFDLGNSPLEYDTETVGGRVLILCSTNGTRAMTRCVPAASAALGAFVNASRSVEWIASGSEPALVLCSGKLRRACLEDVLLAGLIAHRLTHRNATVVLDDGAVMARDLWAKHGTDLRAALEFAEHGRYLASIGFGADLDFCADIDAIDVLPVFREGQIEAA